MRVDAPAARALREVQKLDQAASLGSRTRRFLIAAEDELGAMLELECTGAREDVNGTPAYDHSAETCPIHEWLVPDDYSETER